jgi:hypothetical protein
MSGEAVVVSWPKDRDRFRRALGEFPVVRRARVCAIYGGVSTAAIVILLTLAGRATPATMLSAALPALVLSLPYFTARTALLREVGSGTLTWQLDDDGLRIQGDTATEIPWRQMADWRTAADHLIIEVRRPNGQRPNSACAAPLTAFSPLDRQRSEAMLRERIAGVP